MFPLTDFGGFLLCHLVDHPCLHDSEKKIRCNLFDQDHLKLVD